VNPERVHQLLLSQHVSEKASRLMASANQYVFRVAKDATRLEVRRAVEQIFSVQVSRVSLLVVKGKTRRRRHGVGRRPDWKKAYVRLQPGQSIDPAVIGK